MGQGLESFGGVAKGDDAAEGFPGAAFAAALGKGGQAFEVGDQGGRGELGGNGGDARREPETFEPSGQLALKLAQRLLEVRGQNHQNRFRQPELEAAFPAARSARACL